MKEPVQMAGSRAAPGSAIPSEDEVEFNLALRRWRQLTGPWWRKHENAGRNMMRWMHARGGKARRRLTKWANEYERTLWRMPNPPEHPTDWPPNSSEVAINPLPPEAGVDDGLWEAAKPSGTKLDAISIESTPPVRRRGFALHLEWPVASGFMPPNAQRSATEATHE